ncbi:MAG: GMC family oxidoreductase [Chlamydiales bacterium]|nr:GMC family oxidoreductase [Chlamydiia bacterium]MCP5508750.1 GMC family oxidoreductase [Chlamydiales bacterium]
MDNHYDIIIIGTGAGGGTLAYHLANNSNKRILILERGGYLPREKDNWRSKAVFLDGKYTAAERWLDKDGKPFQPGIHYYVGGNTKMYGAALMRMRERDFEEVEHVDGISPAWPISYKDIAPYYLQAEKLYHVHGQRGSDPFEPPDAAPYPYPAVKHEPRIQELYDDLQKLGHHPFALPLGLKLTEGNPHSPCIKCNSCDGFPCLVNAKADAQVICIDPILDKEHVTMLTNRYIENLEVDDSGRKVTAVHAEYNGQREVYTADTIVVSCGAINSAALLLRSACSKHPDGLANSSGVVGRHYMCHNNSAFVAVSLQPNPTRFQKTLGLSDFYFGDDKWKYPMGLIQMLGKSDADMFKGDAPTFTPTMALDTLAHHALDFWLTTEDLPDPENRVIVDGDGQIHLHYTENNLASHHQLVSRLKEMLNDIGCESHLMPTSVYLGKKIPIAGTAHQCGTVRFGNDPATSAVDIHCKAHDLDNLYVVDGSIFVTASSVNPALTIAANALRVGDHLLG